MLKIIGSKMGKLIDPLCRFYKQIVFSIVAVVIFLFLCVHSESAFSVLGDIGASSLRMKTLAVMAIVFVAVTVMVFARVNKKFIMSTILIMCGVVYMWLFTPGEVPDEPNHFFRAFEVSQGILVSDKVGEKGEGGNHFPEALAFFRDKNAELDWNNTVDIPFSNTALYSAISYLPQALGIGIANLFTDNVYTLFYAGKWGNFIVAMAMCCAALFITPFGEKLFLLTMIFPMSLQEIVSMSPDGFVIGLSMLFIAYILKLTYQDKKIKKKDVVIIALLGVMIALSKIVYIALLLIIFMIPNKNIGEKKQWMWFKFGVVGGACALNLIWLSISSGYLVEFQPGVNSGAQVIYVLTHIPEYVMVVIRTLLENGVSYVEMLIGAVLGPILNHAIFIPDIVYIIFLGLFIYEIAKNRECSVTPKASDKWVMILAFLAGSALIVTSLYVQWTAVANDVINGIQGRYFIPFLPLLGIFVILDNKEKELECGNKNAVIQSPSYFYYIVLLASGIAIIDLIVFYSSIA